MWKNTIVHYGRSLCFADKYVKVKKKGVQKITKGNNNIIKKREVFSGYIKTRKEGFVF